jgi:CRP/FNR family transcriptional regulator
MTPAEVLELDRVAVRRWIEQHHVAALRAFTIAVERADAVLDLLDDVLAPEIAVRVARALVSQAHRFGRQTSAGVRLVLDLSQTELATHVGASRERVNRALSGFVRRGWLHREGTDYLVHDLPALEAYAKMTGPQTRRRAASGAAPPTTRHTSA